jgi:Ca2+-binding EF-hand superfamily protein
MSHNEIRGPLFEARSVLLFTALAFGGFSAASAQSTAPSAADQEVAAVFAKADKNGDKALSAEEAKTLPAVSEQFTQIDSNGDGALSEVEFMKAMKGS